MAEKEYIDKETVLKHFDEVMNNEFCDADFKKAALGFSVYVSRLAAADVAPVKHGHWVKEKSDVLIHWHCSVCKNCYYLDEPNANYCPNCGAKNGRG